MGTTGRPHKYPWPSQAEQPFFVHVMRLPGDVKPLHVVNAAARWAVRHGYRLETRTLGNTVLLRWTRR